ncbi:hypothetical protein HNP33_001176 [Comamonas odontotermitis]|uniref:Uncharacterized protein n=1 Tax=Comamonas odontotermitis TaxID=379895 RepID=A0ABR6RD93_9BURK|nr:hypothetical protein [Comamonas odontotermitis]MBB6577125.1 hypothetical protein [Comamonas odontotermitis]
METDSKVVRLPNGLIPALQLQAKQAKIARRGKSVTMGRYE